MKSKRDRETLYPKISSRREYFIEQNKKYDKALEEIKKDRQRSALFGLIAMSLILISSIIHFYAGKYIAGALLMCYLIYLCNKD